MRVAHRRNYSTLHARWDDWTVGVQPARVEVTRTDPEAERVGREEGVGQVIGDSSSLRVELQLLIVDSIGSTAGCCPQIGVQVSEEVRKRVVVGRF